MNETLSIPQTRDDDAIEQEILSVEAALINDANKERQAGFLAHTLGKLWDETQSEAWKLGYLDSKNFSPEKLGDWIEF